MEKKKYDKIRDVMIGLEIFKKYGGFSCSAEHDSFYSGPELGRETEITAEELKILDEAGWFPFEGGDDITWWEIFV